MNPSWYKLDPAALLLEVTETPDAQAWHRRTLEIAKALIHRERGRDPWADRLIDESEEFSEKRRRAGRASGEARRRRATETRDETRTESETRDERGETESETGGDETESETRDEGGRARTRVEHISTLVERCSNVLNTVRTKPNQTDRRTDRRTDRHIPRSPLPPPPARDGGGDGAGRGRADGNGTGKKPGKNGSGDGDGASDPPPDAASGPHETAGLAEAFRADWRGMVWGMPEWRLPVLAAWYCGETDNAHAKSRYAAAIRRNGASGFRELLDAFVGEVEAGEEPQSRGKAFIARVKAWEDKT